ncbi:hypothetical protein HPB47_025935, partial [Ixodes persulcatus]
VSAAAAPVTTRVLGDSSRRAAEDLFDGDLSAECSRPLSWLGIAWAPMETASLLLRAQWGLLETLNERVEGAAERGEAMLVLLNQLLFLMLCDRWFCPGDRLTGLYTLLFYIILCYLCHYVGNLLNVRGYSPYVHVSDQSKIRHLAMSVTKMVLDLTKGVTVVITVVFMLLVLGLEQGLEHFSPTWTYVLLTALYFCLTERICQDKVPMVLSWLHLEFLENLETLWAPVLCKLATSLSSLLMIVAVSFWCSGKGGWGLCLLASYINVYLGLKAMDRHLKVLLQERGQLGRFRFATKQELANFDDVCSVCLQRMTLARVTPCRHLFHGDCLRRSLKDRSTCPMCKQDLWC